MLKHYRKLITVTLVLVIFSLLLIVRMATPGKSDKTKGNAKGKKNLPVYVNISVIQNGRISEDLSTTGTVLAEEEVDLRSEISGRITKILFAEGSHVRKGQLLVKMFDADLQAQLKKAELKIKLLQDKEYRQRMMLKKDAISQQEYDSALNELNVQEVEIQMIKVDIDKTEIRAPFDGIIGLKSVSVGSYLSPSTKIAMLQKLNNVKVEFSIPEKYSSIVRAGTNINFKLQNSDVKYTASVYAIEPKIATDTRTLILRAICANKDNKIRPGSFAEVNLTLKQADNAIVIPSETIVPGFEGQKVFLYNCGKARQVSITTGIRQERNVQVINGLRAGDSLITSGIMKLKSNMRVIAVRK